MTDSLQPARAEESIAPQSQEDVRNQAPSPLTFPVVGIGASAGGVSALLRFFGHMPATTGMAFVVILHLSPKHESNVDRSCAA